MCGERIFGMGMQADRKLVTLDRKTHQLSVGIRSAGAPFVLALVCSGTAGTAETLFLSAVCVWRIAGKEEVHGRAHQKKINSSGGKYFLDRIAPLMRSECTPIHSKLLKKQVCECVR